MATRQYEFINGPTTSELPSIGTPTGTTDLISLGYADENYMQGGSAKSTLNNLRDVAASARSDMDVRYNYAKDWLYRFEAAATGTDDGDLIIQPTAGSGRWKKILQNLGSNFLGQTDSQNVTNKTVSGSILLDDVYFKSGTGTNRKVKVDVSGATNTTTTTMTFVQTANRAITFQDADHVVVGRDTTDTMSNKTIASGDATTYFRMKTQAELRFSDADDSNYVGFKAASGIAANKVWTLPNADGSANQALVTDGSLGLSWATIASTSLSQYNTDIGDSGGSRTTTNTNLLGNIKATTGSATATMTIATPAVVTCTSHGLVSGDKIYFTTTGALPTGVTASTTYYVLRIDADTFNICTSLANVGALTKIATSGSQSGTHTLFFGGLKFLTDKLPGVIDGSNATTGYVGEYIENNRTTGSPSPNFSNDTIGSLDSGNVTFNDGNETGITLGPGDWDIQGYLHWLGSGAGVCTSFETFIGTAKGNSSTGQDRSKNYSRLDLSLTTARLTQLTPVWRVSITTATTYYLKAQVSISSGTVNAYGVIRARRVR